MFCNKCNFKNEIGSRFCAGCGCELDSNVVQNDGNNYQMNNDNLNVEIHKEMINTNNGKNNYSWVIVLIVIFVFLIFGLGYYGLQLINAFEDNDGNEVQKPEMQTKLSKIELKKMNFTYDSSVWTENVLADGTESKGARNNNSLIGIMYSESKYYYTSYNFAKEMKDMYNDQNKIILNDMEKVLINGLEWYKLVVQDGDYISLLLYYSKGYDLYSFTYKARTTTYYQELNKAEIVYETLQYDNSDDIMSQNAAKKKLIGEWDWGSLGYVVVDNERIYIYKDVSKDKNNVLYGTYVAYDKVATAAAGYVEGIDIIITGEKLVMNGVESEVSDLEYVLIPQADGSYKLKNLLSGSTGVAKKVK